MADLSSQDLQRLTDALEGLTGATRQLDEDTIALRRAQKQREEDVKRGATAAVDALGKLAGAGMAAGKAMLEGQKGASAFNSSLDELASSAKMAGMALALLIPGGPALKLFISGVTAATTATLKYTQAANTMADQLHKGFTGIAKSGAAASDGMTGVYRDAKKLGLSMGELDQMVNLVAENSKDFALFAGSVFEGRKRFADLGEAMTPARQGLLNLYGNMEELNSATAGYLRLQARIGQTQNKTTNELTESTKKYLYEQDALTKLTGLTRKEQEAAREEIRSQERFAAVLQQMRARGQTEQAKQLEDSYLILRSQSKDAAQGFADISTGNLQTEAAQKSMLATQGDSMRAAQQIQAGQLNAAQAAQKVATAYGNTAERVGSLGLVGQFDSTFGSLSDAIKLGAMSQQDINKQYQKVIDERNRQAAGADKMLDQQTSLIQSQMAANKAMENFIVKGIEPAQRAMEKLAKLTEAGSKSLDAITGKDKGTAMGAGTGAGVGMVAGAGLGALIGSLVGPIGTALGAKLGAVLGTAAGAAIGGYLGGNETPTGDKLPKAADGGLLSGPKSGYLAMLHGTELVIPEHMLKGFDMPVGSITPEMSEQHGRMLDLANEMLKDAVALTRINDQDLVRTKNFSRVTDKYVSLKTDLMEQDIDLMEEQQDILEDIEAIYKKAFGEQKAKEMIRAFKVQRINTVAGGMPVMSGTGAPWMSGAGIPVTSGTSPIPEPAATAPAGAPKAPALEPSPVPTAVPKAPAPPAATSAEPKAPAPAAAPKAPKLAAAPSLPSMGGAQGLQIKSQSDLERLGLRMKKGDVQAESAKISPKLIELARTIQSSLPNFGMFTGFNDQFHNEKFPASTHTKGIALDFTLTKAPSKEDGEKIASWLKSMGASFVQDEYNFPSAGATGGHFHAQVPAFAEGGVVDKATLAQIGEKGPEAVVPLSGGRSIPVEIKGGSTMDPEALSVFKSLAEMTNKMTETMDEMLRVQKAATDAQQKMLRMQS